MNNITYTINKLETSPLENQMINVVKTVHYSAKLNDGEYEVEVIGSIDLTSPNQDNFIAYDLLTESVVLNWIKNFINKETIEYALKNKLNFLKNPTVYQDPPWINNSTN